MPLQPSRRDVLGPPPRDVSDLARITRHHGSKLKSIETGIDGRHGTPRPVRQVPSQIVGDASSGDNGGQEIAFWNTDIFTVKDSNDFYGSLTYEPLEGSEDVSWHPAGGGGLRMTANQFVREGRTLLAPTFTGLSAGDLIVCEYAYELDVDPDPATISVYRGSSTAQGEIGNPAISSLALPTGTVGGDLIVVAAIGADGAVPSVTDGRLTSVGYGVWMGFAHTLGALAVAAPANAFWAVTCITLASDAVSWTAPSATSASIPSPSGSLAVGTVDGVASAICAVFDSHLVVHGSSDTPTGWSIGAGSGTGIWHTRIDYWTDTEEGTTPAGTTAVTGGDGTTTSVVVGLIGV